MLIENRVKRWKRKFKESRNYLKDKTHIPLKGQDIYDMMPVQKPNNVNPNTSKVPEITSTTVRVPRKGSNAHKRFVKA